MELSKQVVSLELAKELKEAGYPQGDIYPTGGLWYWVLHNKDKTFSKYRIASEQWINPRGQAVHYAESYGDNGDFEKLVEKFKENIYVAPTVAELGEALPEEIYINSMNHRFEMLKRDKEYLVGYRYFAGCNYFNDINEVNARAKCWLYLKKNGYLDKEASNANND